MVRHWPSTGVEERENKRTGALSKWRISALLRSHSRSGQEIDLKMNYRDFQY